MSDKKKIKIFMGIPSTGERVDSQCFMLREIEKRYGDEVELIYPKKLTFRIFHDFARNAAVEEFLESGADILWFLDADVTPPPHVLDLVTLHGDKWLAAGAPYPVFMTPPGDESQQVVFTVYRKNDKGGLCPTYIPHEGTDWVDGVATGCLFIKREVFSKLKKPYFYFEFDPESRNPTSGEDLNFCKALSSLGIRFFVDFSMPCKHLKKLDLLDVNNYAVTFANRSIMQYDAKVKVQVQALADVIKMLRAENNALKAQLSNKPKLVTAAHPLLKI